MPAPSTPHRTYTFGDFTLDIDRGALRRCGEDVRLRPKSFEVLVYLLERHGTLVDRNELRNAIWGHTVVTDDALTQCLIDIRRAIGDRDRSIVRTMPRRGYMLDAAVSYTENEIADGSSPDNGARKTSWIATSLLASIALVALVWWSVSTERPSNAVATTSPAVSLAVLPFNDMSADQNQQYFADGVAEDLLTLLAKIPELPVTSRTSSFSFRGRNVDISTVAEQLNVTHVLEGSVRKDGEVIRVTVQLIEAKTDTHVWSETYDRKLNDVLSLQDEIVLKIITQLRIELLGDQPRATIVDGDVYAAMLEAKALLDTYDRENLPKVAFLLKKALDIQPDYVAALIQLARLYMHESANDMRPQQEAIELYFDTIARASELAPDNGVLHIFLGLAPSALDDDLFTPAPHIVRAMQLDPANEFIAQSAAYYALRIGRFEVAKELGHYAVQRNPFCLQCQGRLGEAYLATGDFDEARAVFEDLLAHDTKSTSLAHYHIGLTHLLDGNLEAALDEFEKENEEYFRKSGLAMAYYKSGRLTEFEQAFEDLRQYDAIHHPAAAAAVNTASMYAWSGQKDLAFDSLTKGLQASESANFFNEIFGDPLFQNLHDDPRWNEFLEKTGTLPAQLASIDFDIELPL